MTHMNQSVVETVLRAFAGSFPDGPTDLCETLKLAAESSASLLLTIAATTDIDVTILHPAFIELIERTVARGKVVRLGEPN